MKKPIITLLVLIVGRRGTQFQSSSSKEKEDASKLGGWNVIDADLYVIFSGFDVIILRIK